MQLLQWELKIFIIVRIGLCTRPSMLLFSSLQNNVFLRDVITERDTVLHRLELVKHVT